MTLSNTETTIQEVPADSSPAASSSTAEGPTDPPADSLPAPPSAKDGGYGWVVVTVVFCVNTITAGYVKSFGILYVLILEYFPDASGAAAGWIMGLLVGCRGLLSPVMGALTVMVGPQVCVAAGALLTVLGLLLAVPAFSITYMAFTLGGLVGTGLCMSETPGFLVVTDYFLEKRPLANGLRAAGNPMGGVLFAPLVVFLQQEFGLRGAFLIMAGIMLQLFVLALLMRPFEQHKKMVHEKYRRKMMKERQGSNSEMKTETRATDRERPKAKPKKKPLDFTILKNPAYLVYLVMTLCNSVALPSALLYTPVYGKSIGLTAYENSIIASYTSGCDFCMRVVSGWINNTNLYKRRHGLIAGLLIGGVGCLTVPLCTTLWHLIAAVTLQSWCMASFWTLINVLMADQFGGDAMPSTWGFFRTTQGICNFFYPTIIGLVMDSTGGVTVPFLFMGSAIIMGAFVFSLQPLVARLSGAKIVLD